ncbi:MAG: hypothetical protein JSR28_04305 [Proteobacteria bacterium]|nr:hypothetical protein [Pseudomonadota bacterium]MDE2411388.1 hypothetical protein [Sphingomonadales bacterium]
MRTLVFATFAALTLSGCIMYHNRSDGITRLRIDETGMVDGPKVTPLKVIEDSRCPVGTQCVWAGQVKVSVRIDTGPGSETRELTLGKGEQVADGKLTLVEVLPQKQANRTIYPDEYRFGFTFAGGF